ncbi:MAG: hypothetical protein HC913_11275 [Microscillaceae bacterium]|nr:hypothetical protein [Microscillaceae bacterium]
MPTELTPETERALIEKFFAEARQTLHEYLSERELELSNAQLFALLLVSPITIAIASDGSLDFSEVNMLVDIAAYFEKDVLPKQLDHFTQPEKVMSDNHFRKIVFSELRYLSLHMAEHEAALLMALHQLIHLDDTVSRPQASSFSVRRRIVEMMQSVIYNNLGPDAVEESKLRAVLQKLGLA